MEPSQTSFVPGFRLAGPGHLDSSCFTKAHYGGGSREPLGLLQAVAIVASCSACGGMAASMSSGYKDVTQVVQTCQGLCDGGRGAGGGGRISGGATGHDAGISKKAIKLKPVAVVKG